MTLFKLSKKELIGCGLILLAFYVWLFVVPPISAPARYEISTLIFLFPIFYFIYNILNSIICSHILDKYNSHDIYIKRFIFSIIMMIALLVINSVYLNMKNGFIINIIFANIYMYI